jgi:hypothetical protein
MISRKTNARFALIHDGELGAISHFKVAEFMEAADAVKALFRDPVVPP